jgi:hypothetical protein
LSASSPALAVFGQLIEADYRLVAATLGLLGLLVALYLLRKVSARARTRIDRS